MITHYKRHRPKKIKELIDILHELPQNNTFDSELKSKLNAETKTLSAQISSSTPKINKLQSSLNVIKKILNHAAIGAASKGVLGIVTEILKLLS